MRSNNWNDEDEISRDSNSAHTWNSKIFSEGVRISQEGAVRDFVCSSFLEYGETPKNYVESVALVLRMVPLEYRSTLVVHSDSDEELRYSQEIRFRPKWVVRSFEETVYNYPKEVLKRYVSTLSYDRDSRPRTFVSGLKVCAPVNSADLGQLLTPPPSPEPASGMFQNGMNGTPEKMTPDIRSIKGKLGFDENDNSFRATKEIALNGV